MASEELVSVSVRVPRTVKERLDEIADANYRSLASQVLLILEDFVSKADSRDAKTSPRRDKVSA